MVNNPTRAGMMRPRVVEVGVTLPMIADSQTSDDELSNTVWRGAGEDRKPAGCRSREGRTWQHRFLGVPSRLAYRTGPILQS